MKYKQREKTDSHKVKRANRKTKRKFDKKCIKAFVDSLSRETNDD